MTLYYTIVFIMLIAEMAGFFLLVAPLPTTARRKLLLFLSENAFMAQIQLALKFTFFFILILFADSVNRVYRVQQEITQAHEGGNVPAGIMLGVDRHEIQVRRFYSQRNMYLCGFTLFLSHILYCTYNLVLELTEAREQLSKAAESGKGSSANVGDLNAEISELKEIIQQKDMDIEHLKKQSEGLSKEYFKISDELNEKSGFVAENKKTY